MWLCKLQLQKRFSATLVFGALMAALQAYIFFGPPPTSDRAIALTALGHLVAPGSPDEPGEFANTLPAEALE
jgi:hypothetical protein